MDDKNKETFRKIVSETADFITGFACGLIIYHIVVFNTLL